MSSKKKSKKYGKTLNRKVEQKSYEEEHEVERIVDKLVTPNNRVRNEQIYSNLFIQTIVALTIHLCAILQ